MPTRYTPPMIVGGGPNNPTWSELVSYYLPQQLGSQQQTIPMLSDPSALMDRYRGLYSNPRQQPMPQQQTGVPQQQRGGLGPNASGPNAPGGMRPRAPQPDAMAILDRFRGSQRPLEPARDRGLAPTPWNGGSSSYEEIMRRLQSRGRIIEPSPYPEEAPPAVDPAAPVNQMTPAPQDYLPGGIGSSLRMGNMRNLQRY